MKKYFSLQWHITNECDQRCAHCYIWQKHEKIGLYEVTSISKANHIIRKFIMFCREINMNPYISITGGDPLLHKDIWSILSLLKDNGIKFTILGNPYHLSEKTAKMLRNFGCVSYQMSLDGLKTIHDSIRGRQGSFEETVSKIHTLNENNIKSMIMTTVSLLNIKDIPKVVEVCVNNGVKNFAFSRYCPTHGDTQYNIPPQTYRIFLSKMWDVYKKYLNEGTNFALKDHLWVPFLYENNLYALSDHKEPKDIVLDGCNCGISHMTLLPNGEVYACRRFKSSVGNINNSSFKEIFFSERMNSYRNITKLEGCNKCELLYYCRGCHAVSAGMTGNYFTKDPQCWRC